MGEAGFHREARLDEVQEMQTVVTEALAAGAGGFSTSRSWAHLTPEGDPVASRLASWDEVGALVGVLATAHELGVQVPGQLSIVGFDDTPQAAWTTPALTTVRQDLDGMGRLAVHTVLAMSSGERPPSRQVELATSLTVRGTTGPAPAPPEER